LRSIISPVCGELSIPIHDGVVFESPLFLSVPGWPLLFLLSAPGSSRLAQASTDPLLSLFVLIDGSLPLFKQLV